jgi:hypothetical protein
MSDVEAAGFDTLAGDGVAVAILPAAARSEFRGGPQAVAAEIAREAGLDGTLVALVGTRLAAVSKRVPPQRLDQLVHEASAEPGSPAVQLERLTRAVRAEQPDTAMGAPWAGSPASRPGCCSWARFSPVAAFGPKGLAPLGPGDPEGRPYEKTLTSR